MQRWLRNHPLLAASSLFIMLVMGSFFSVWYENGNLSVSKLPNLIVNHNTVIVPKGKVVTGNVVVQNGKLEIEGEVKGNVTVINGREYMASAGKVTGNVQVVNEVFGWIWYSIKKTGKDDFSLAIKNK